MKKTSLLFASVASTFLGISTLMCGCSNAMFDSSVGPDGKKISLDNEIQTATKTTAKKTANKVIRKAPVSTVKSTVTSKQVTQALNEELKAGVVKPYVPTASEQSTLLPTIDFLKDKENTNPLSKVSVQDVVSGKVDLNNLNQDTVTQAATAALPVAQTSEPQAFEPVQTAQNLTPLVTQAEQVATQANQVEVVGSSIEQNVEDLGLSSDKCGNINNDAALQVAYNTTVKQATRLVNEVGPIYIAPTVVSNSLSDCIKDVSPGITQALNQSGIQTVVGDATSIQQNSGSATVIPALIKACKRTGIPLLNVSVVRTIGPKTVVTIRNIRVKDGITLVQNTTQL